MVSGQLHGPAALTPGNNIRYPFYRSVDGPRLALDAVK
jgi:hypothetical protein